MIMNDVLFGIGMTHMLNLKWRGSYPLYILIGFCFIKNTFSKLALSAHITRRNREVTSLFKCLDEVHGWQLATFFSSLFIFYWIDLSKYNSFFIGTGNFKS